MVGAHGSKQCGLWQKESHRANALYVDCFADLDANHKKSVDNILHDALNSQPKKSDIASEQFQRLGAREFRKRKWNEAIELYNRALCMAENGSFNLQLSYEGRSNCLAKRDMTEVASIDMDFVASRPAKRRSERIQNRKLSSTTRTMRTFVPNRKFPSLASALEVRQNSKFGRHIVSNRDIGVGNTIAIERQFASVICSDESKEQQAYCLTCFRTDAHFIPCPNCVDVMYCSRTCQQNNDIHQLECQSLFHRLNSSKAKLAVQMVLIAVKHFPNVDALIAFVEGIINDSSNNLNELANDAFPSYGVLLKLQCCPTKNDKIRAFDAFKLMMTTMPTIQHYFASKSSQRFLQHLLIHHLGIVRSNGFYDTSGWTNNLECKYIHDTISLLNHSCAPNAFYMLHNNVGTLLTVRPIKKGDQPSKKISMRNFSIFFS